MFLSVFDLFKVGVGPSSSHTMGPMTAACIFVRSICDDIEKITITLYGSLAFTGKGHATDKAAILGLNNQMPDEIDANQKDAIIAKIEQEKSLILPSGKKINFDPEQDIIFNYEHELPLHPNGMMIRAYNNNKVVMQERYYSIGGGFVVTEQELQEMPKNEQAPVEVTYPFKNGQEMLDMAKKHGLSIAQMKYLNELCIMTKEDLEAGLDKIWQTMINSIDRGLSIEGFLPGGLNVKRRAKDIAKKLNNKNIDNGSLANEYLSLYAIAVNEENASGGNIVTAPTNGAAGVIPAVIRFYQKFYHDCSKEKVYKFLLTAAAIGGLLKTNASISGAEVGCQGEVGSASAMAAAGLAACLGGTAEQVENAAEIALEHHLGLTCDPVAGLVQIPCIERNAMGAIKAVAAASLAMLGNGKHFVTLDACIRTMKETGLDMCSKYKETSLAGLAVNVVNC